MLTKRKAPVANRGKSEGSAAGAIITEHFQYSTNRPHLQDLLAQALARMKAAAGRDDLSTAHKHFRIWQSLSAAAYGLPYGGDYA